MKVLRIVAEGLPLFAQPLDICFYARQRVTERDRHVLVPLCPGIYMHGASAFIGINASGKTSAMKVVLLAIGILNNESINHIEGRDILGRTGKVVLSMTFFSRNQKLYCLRTEIEPRILKNGECHYVIGNEALWVKNAGVRPVKKHLMDFSGSKPVSYRNDKEEYLPDDVSFIIAHNRKEHEHTNVASLLSLTNVNVLPVVDTIPPEVIEFLDPAIEELSFEQKNGKPLIRLKFKGDDTLWLNSAAELENYLSSGTIKGIVTFTLAKDILSSGGYLIVDEIENHFNREIVATLLRFFIHSDLNKNGGTLIFTTHYPELLDEYDRNDGIYIVRNSGGISVENLANILTRNDIKKSEAYQSGFLEGTAPRYEAYLKLKKALFAHHEEGPSNAFV